MNTLSPEDFNQRYVGTFIRHISENQTPKLICVEHIDIKDHRTGLVHIVSLESGSASLKYPQCLSNFDLDSPSTGYFNLTNYAIYLFRYPDRQWKRGVSNRNTELYNPLQFIMESLHVYKPSLGFKTIDAAFNKNFCPNIEHALLCLKKSHISIALSSKLMISLSPIADVPFILWWGCIPVGKFVNNKFQICDPVFEQEVFDEFQKLDINRQWMNF